MFGKKRPEKEFTIRGKGPPHAYSSKRFREKEKKNVKKKPTVAPRGGKEGTNPKSSYQGPGATVKQKE